MKKEVTKFMLIAFVVGFLLACVSISANFGLSKGGIPNITCSADGKYVYVSDTDSVYKSNDFGDTWKRIPVADLTK
jgi:hypothetical protein